MNVQLRYSSFLKDLDNQIETVSVGGKLTKELIGEVFDYEFDIFDSDIQAFLGSSIKPPHQDDKTERTNLMSLVIEQTSKSKNDLASRQMVISPKYVGDTDRASCISTIHILYRNGKAILNIYQRSQNIENFKYDQQTYMFLAKIAANVHKYTKCEINVIIGSLHKYV